MTQELNGQICQVCNTRIAMLEALFDSTFVCEQCRKLPESNYYQTTIKICKQVNCNNEAVKIENHWSGDEYCRECVTKLDQMADGEKEQNDINMARYGNKYGTINAKVEDNEYWGRKQYQ